MSEERALFDAWMNQPSVEGSDASCWLQATSEEAAWQAWNARAKIASDKLRAVERQRDELLAALREMMSPDMNGPASYTIWAKARAALANAERQP